MIDAIFVLYQIFHVSAVYLRIPSLVQYANFDVVFGTANSSAPQRENAMRGLAFDDASRFAALNLTEIYTSPQSFAYSSIVVSSSSNNSPSRITDVHVIKARSQQLVDFEVTLHQLVNVVRLRRQLTPLNANVELIRSARRHSDDMNLRQYFSTSSPEGLEIIHRIRAQGYQNDNHDFVKYAENVAFGYRDPSEVLAVWMGIPKLRDSIINPEYTDLGIGLSTENFRWTQVFGFNERAA